MKPSKGYCAGTRSLMTKELRQEANQNTKFPYEYKIGASVIIKIDSSQQKALPHRRFHGKIGTVVDKRGRGYVVKLPKVTPCAKSSLELSI